MFDYYCKVFSCWLWFGGLWVGVVRRWVCYYYGLVVLVCDDCGFDSLVC